MPPSSSVASDAARVDSAEPDEPWYLATTAPSVYLAAAWYRQGIWVEESFRDDKSRLRLAEAQVESALRQNHLLLALTIAVTWLCLIADPKTGVLPEI